MSQLAIFVSCSRGWAYDHCKAITETVAGSGYRCQAQLFDLSQPHFCQPGNGALQGNIVINETLNVKKRKRPRSMTTQSNIVIDLESGVSLEAAALEVTQLVQNSNFAGVKWVCGAFKSTNDTQKPINDSIDYVGLSDLAKQCQIGDDLEEIYHLHLGENVVTYVVSKVVKNPCESCIVLNALGVKFLIPPRSTFLMSDIENIGKLVNLDQKYDFMVIDPPWCNKSVKRSRTYKHLSFHSIKLLPIQRMASSESIIAVWVTNKAKVIDFVLQELFPSWSLQLIGKWYWIKVTTNGEFVYNFHSTHKKPYECLLIGHYNEDSEKLQPSKTVEHFPFHKIICSVPCRLHSRKPMLQEFIGEFLPKDACCLELFARNLTPGWTSWGNEVLKYQNTCYFETCDENLN